MPALGCLAAVLVLVIVGAVVVSVALAATVI